MSFVSTRSTRGSSLSRATSSRYLGESGAAIDIVPGDARVSLAAEPPQQFDVLAVDAFSGDAIPVHLLTAQAFALYRRHLKPGGIVAMHVSNRYLNLAPVVHQQAAHAGLRSALVSSPDEDSLAVYRADWVLVSADSAFFSVPEVAAATDSSSGPTDLRLWTDDYNSLLPVVIWSATR